MWLPCKESNLLKGWQGVYYVRIFLIVFKYLLSHTVIFPGTTTGAVSLKMMKLINVLIVVIETETGIVAIRIVVGCLVMMKKNSRNGSLEGPLGMVMKLVFYFIFGCEKILY